jgi:hypothetical protein
MIPSFKIGLWKICELLGMYPEIPKVCNYCMQEKQKFKNTKECISKMNITGKELAKVNSCYR